MEADSSTMNRRRLLLVLIPTVVATVAVTFLVLWLVFWRGGSTGVTQGEGGTLEVQCSIDKPVGFEFGGEQHEAQLLETVGSSARIVFSSDSPNEVTLTRGLPAEIDLDSDALPDASATLVGLSSNSARIEIAPIGSLAWDETGFTTSGGFRPYKHSGNAGNDDFTVVPQDDSYLLLYVSEDRKLNWEGYDSTGALMTVPELRVGVVDPGMGTGKVSSVDGALLDGDIALAVKTDAGVSVRTYDDDFFTGGQPLYVGRDMNDPVLVAGGEHTYVVTSGYFDPPRSNDGKKDRIIVTEADLSGSPVILRQDAVTDTQDRERDICCDAAWDEETGLLVVAYKHQVSSFSNTELRLTAVDPETLTQVWNSVVGPAAARSDKPDVSVASSGGTATLIWRHDSSADGGMKLHVSTADLANGEVTRVWDGQTAQDSPRALEGYPCDLVPYGSQFAFAYYDTHAKPEAPSGSPDRARFALWPWEGSGWAPAQVLLDGGKPLLADPLINLNSFSQAPSKAICGAPAALKGNVVNRGSRKADDVVVTASVGDEQIGEADIGRIEEASSAEFSIIWDVPEDFTAEQVEISFALTTSSEQYTTGNDEAAHSFLVRQKGLVTGRVVDASSDVRHRTGWYLGLANAQVTIGDHSVLTDIGGFFTLDGLDFGTYAVVVEKEGYNRLETEFTVSRTQPLAFVSAEMDNHGKITLKVMDEAENPLEGVDVYLHDYRESERTPTSGELTWDISARTYTFSFVKRGYHAVGGEQVEVVLGEERTHPVTMREATTAFLGGMIVDQRGAPVGSASVTIKDESGAVVAQPPVSEGGTFEPVELGAKPPKVYEVTVEGNGITITEAIQVFGGDDLFYTFGLVPGRGERRVRTATEGYTSWMIQAGYCGYGEVGATDMYTWYGNYAICVGTEYWGGNKELSAVDVTVWGGSYESHATKSELDLLDILEVPGAAIVSGITHVINIGVSLIEDHPDDVGDVGDAIMDEWVGDVEDSVITGQGNELLTWKEATSDFAPQEEFNSSDPQASMWNVVSAVPDSFAIPIVIGGSSEQLTAVRVDQVDVVRMATGESIDLSGPGNAWSSYQGPEGSDNNNGKRYEVAQMGVPYDEVVVYVWLTVQKYSHGTPYGTGFRQRQQQVVVFKPGPQSLGGYVASGYYRDPSRLAP
jgi:hypothetical protein